LRNHHWKNGMPKEFAIDWFKSARKDFSDEEELLMEYQVIINKLDLPYSVQDIEVENAAEPQKEKSNLGKNYGKKKVSVAKANYPAKSQPIPSIDTFFEFKNWLLNKLDQLEGLK